MSGDAFREITTDIEVSELVAKASLMLHESLE